MNNNKEILSVSGNTSVELKKEINKLNIQKEQIVNIVYSKDRFVCFYYR